MACKGNELLLPIFLFVLPINTPNIVSSK